MGQVAWVNTRPLVCGTPSARSADAREARFFIEFIEYWRVVYWPHLAFLFHGGVSGSRSVDLCDFWFLPPGVVAGARVLWRRTHEPRQGRHDVVVQGLVVKVPGYKKGIEFVLV